MKYISLYVALCSCFSGYAQYSGPESVEYDPAGDRYFVSCTANDSIVQRDQSGIVTGFASVAGSPYGLELQGDTLFACVGGIVKGYSTATGSQVFSRSLGGSFLNGLSSDGHFLYATDFSQQTIFRVEPSTNSFISWVSDTQGTPNGCVVDSARNTLWVAFWGSNAPVKGYDLQTAELVTTFPTTLGNIDGITLDCAGRLLLASWSPNRISRFDPDVVNPAFENLMITGLNHPADIDYDVVHDRVCIPNAGNNTVSLPEVVGCVSAVFEQIGYQTIKAVPNPTDGFLHLELMIEEPQIYMIFSQAGLLIASGTLKPRTMLDLSSLDAGAYVIDLPQLKQYVRVVKK
jgi:DNA-binding beta-propeller fold protein YncE